MNEAIEVERALVLSTGHVSRECADWLASDAASDQYVVDAYAYGWRVYCGDVVPDSSCPASLQACIRLAREHDCTWIKFDQDGPHVDCLPTYEW